jgi:hypothetical protein
VVTFASEAAESVPPLLQPDRVNKADPVIIMIKVNIFNMLSSCVSIWSPCDPYQVVGKKYLKFAVSQSHPVAIKFQDRFFCSLQQQNMGSFTIQVDQRKLVTFRRK